MRLLCASYTWWTPVILKFVSYGKQWRNSRSLWSAICVCAFMCACISLCFCVAANVTFAVPCQRGTLPAFKHLTLQSIFALLENIITDKRRTSGREHDTNAQKLTASRAFSPLLILCTSFSNSAKLVKERKTQTWRQSLSIVLYCTSLQVFNLYPNLD